MSADSQPPSEIVLTRMRELAQHIEAHKDILGQTMDAMLEPLYARIAALEQALSNPYARPLSEERKVVTVLFADVSGFTAMSEKMDAEEVADTMNACWRQLDAAIIKNHGRIDKHIGDAIMAVWGIPRATENDAANAIRAGMALQGALNAFSAELEKKHGITLRMRVGINTGPVLAGHTGTTGEYTVMGDTVNLASRLEHAAPVGHVQIGHATYRHVRGLFDLEAQEPMPIKGKSELVQAYLVIGERARPDLERRGIEGVETPMVGRDTEMTTLQTLYVNVVNEQRPQLAMIIGEAGLGKSRLLFEFRNWLDVQPGRRWLLRGRSRAETVTLPFFPWRAALADRFGLVEGEHPELSREKFERGVAELWGALDGQSPLEAAHSIGYLFGLDWPESSYLGPLRANPQLAQGRAFYWMQQLFMRMGKAHPLVLVLEDVHWADSGSIDLLNYLLGAGEGLPLYIVGATRPELFEKFPALRDDTATRTHVRLQPLTAEAAQALLQHIFEQAAAEHIPTELIERVTHQAEGNPYYLEELVKVLVERGVIVTAPTGWRVVIEKLAQMQLPDTLQGLLQTRLDALEPQEKSTAQRSAVVGRNFWTGVLETMQPEAAVLPILKQLEVREMVYPRHESAFVGEHEYIFKTMLLRDVAYETLPRKQRRVYHATIAEWLEKMSSDDPTWAAQIAEHYEQAEQRKEAVELYRLAAEGAAKRFANREAVDLYTKALSLSDSPQEKFELLVGRERANDWLGQRAQQRADVEQMLELAKQLQSPEREVQALNRQANLLARTGDSAGATATAQRVLQEAQRLNLPGEEAQALRNLSIIAYFSTQYLESLQYAERSLHASRIANDSGLTIDNLNAMGLVSSEMGYYDQALRYYADALRQAESQGDDFRRARVLGNASILESDRGRYQMALAQKNEVLELQRKMGNRNSEAIAQSNLGDEYRLVGQFELAEEKFRESIKLFKSLESLWGLAGTLSSQALMRIDQGRYVEALAILDEAQQLIRGRKVAQGAMMEIFNRRIGANLRLGDRAAVEATLAETEQWLDDTGFEPANKELALLDSYKAEYCLLKGEAASAVELSAEAIKVSKGHRLPSEVMRLILWIHYRALSACGYMEQALAVLNQVRTLIAQSAKELDENLRASFLQNVQLNRTILAEAQRVMSEMREG